MDKIGLHKARTCVVKLINWEEKVSLCLRFDINNYLMNVTSNC